MDWSNRPSKWTLMPIDCIDNTFTLPNRFPLLRLGVVSAGGEKSRYLERLCQVEIASWKSVVLSNRNFIDEEPLLVHPSQGWGLPQNINEPPSSSKIGDHSCLIPIVQFGEVSGLRV